MIHRTRTSRPVRWTRARIETVQARVAQLVLSQSDDCAVPAAMGDVVLLPHQCDAVARLRAALSEFHGALLADDVGLGKTFVALAVAREYSAAHVLAPAALLPMWRAALTRTRSTHVSVHSLHGCSRTAPEFSLLQHASPHLVIVDESHHLRTTSTQRYRIVSNAVVGHDVLLLSATPLHNRPRELHALLGLFAGSRDDLLRPDLLSRLIVRRSNARVGSPRPVVHQHAPLTAPHDPATLSAILALPAPLPAHDGAEAGALIRLGLLRAWCSSDAALAHSIRRRLLRGEALREALSAGRHPSNAELRGWFVGDHEVQFAFPELMAGHIVEQGPLMAVLESHLVALRALETHHQRSASGDHVRVQHIRRILASHQGDRDSMHRWSHDKSPGSAHGMTIGKPVPVIAFSQYTATLRALYRALSDIAGVGVLTGRHGQIASGRISRAEVLARFAPVAQGRPPPPPHGAIRLLLTTDLLAEGVNLQDAGVVIHLDLPWTDALRQQRVGRAARMGALHTVVHVYTLEPPPAAAEVLRLHQRIEEKADISTRLVGGSDIVGDTMHSAADCASYIRQQMHAWRSSRTSSSVASVTAETDLCVALVTGAPNGALAVVEESGIVRLLACTPLVTDDVALIASVVRNIQYATQNMNDVRPEAIEPGRVLRTVRALNTWRATRHLRENAGASPVSITLVQRRMSAHIRSVVGDLPAMRRQRWLADVDHALQAVNRARGTGAERALEVWFARRGELTMPEWLVAWRDSPVLGLPPPPPPLQHAAAHTPENAPARAATWRIRALVLLEPASN